MSKKKGEIVYAYDKRSKCYLKAAIKEVHPKYYVLDCLTIVDKNAEPIMMLGGHVGCRKGECFSNIQSLIQYRKNQDKKEMEIYEREIFNIPSLLAFPLKYDISNTAEYPNLLAQKVYKQKVQEYFFLHIEEE